MSKQVSERVPWGILTGFTIFILALAYVVEKEISLPSPVILGIALFGGGFLAFSSFSYPEYNNDNLKIFMEELNRYMAGQKPLNLVDMAKGY